MLSLFGQQRLSLKLLGTCCAAAAARLNSCHASYSFRAADLVVQERRSVCTELPEDLAFGKVFTDHMLLVEHSTKSGWDVPHIIPFGALQLHPAAQVLHYGMCCFEGMKAYQGADKKGRLFRPEMNMARLLRSAQRLMLAEFDPKELQECIIALLRLDRAWMPDRPGHSMYIRPFLFASDGALGVHRSSRTTLSVIMSPVGPYFTSGTKAVRLFLDTSNVRAWPGGAGAFKVGGNYAPTVQPQMAALHKHNCSQVVYTLSVDPDDPGSAVISECGAMNLFFVLQQSSDSSNSSSEKPALEVVTPPLDGTILPGITRDSIIQLLQQRPDVAMVERPLTVRELLTAHREGRLLEVFGSGTACVVQPVDCIVTADGSQLHLPANGSTKAAENSGTGGAGVDGIAGTVKQQLLDIQYGKVPHPWSVPYE